MFSLIAQENDLAPIFGEMSQGEKLSEIKPPLELDIVNCEVLTLFLGHLS